MEENEKHRIDPLKYDPLKLDIWQSWNWRLVLRKDQLLHKLYWDH